MKISDVARIHRVSERTVRRWIRNGQLRSRTVHGVTHVDGHAAELAADRWRKRNRARVAAHVMMAAALETGRDADD